MPSASLQSLIDTFENVEANSAVRSPYLQPNAALSQPNQRLDVKVESSQASTENLLESPTSPTASSLSLISPIQPTQTPTPSRSPSPAILGRKSSLIDVKEFEPPSTSTDPNRISSSKQHPTKTPPPLKPKPVLKSNGPAPGPPALPPRRASSTSSVSNSPGPSSANTIKHSYPPIPPKVPPRHTPTISTTSFQSASLCDDTKDAVSMFDSMEIVPSVKRAKDANLSMKEERSSTPPRLPPRPSPNAAVNDIKKRRPPPPPPPPPIAETKSRPSAIAQVPPPQIAKPPKGMKVDMAARLRYESLFERNLFEQNKRTSQKSPKGWRASSDVAAAIFRSTPPPPPDNTRLEGTIIKLIWDTSKLSRFQLRRIWAQCNPSLHGSLDRESFVVGMWLIDEELKQAQRLSRKGGSKARYA